MPEPKTSGLEINGSRPGLTAELARGREKLLGHLAMLLFAALIAGSFSIGHLAAPHISPSALNAIRFVSATIIMAVAHRFIYRQLPGAPESLWRFAVLGGLMAVYFILMFVALRLSNPVSTGAVFTLIPLMSAGFGWLFLRQTTRPAVMLSLVIGALGAIWVIFRGDLQAILRFQIDTGEMIFFVGCVCHAAYAPLVRKFNRGEPVLLFTVMTLAATAIWIVVVGAADIVSTDWLSLPMIVWIAIAYLAIFTTAGTFFLLQFASLRLPASKVLSYGYLTPAFIIVLEGLIGHGWTSLSVVMGALVTAAALLVMALLPDR
jgi:drug/metabolite transporter (DMT)-like permease